MGNVNENGQLCRALAENGLDSSAWSIGRCTGGPTRGLADREAADGACLSTGKTSSRNCCQKKKRGRRKIKGPQQHNSSRQITRFSSHLLRLSSPDRGTDGGISNVAAKCLGFVSGGLVVDIRCGLNRTRTASHNRGLHYGFIGTRQ